MSALSKYDPSEEEMSFAMSSIPFTPSDRTKSTAPSKYEATDDELDFAHSALSEPVSEELPWYKSYPAAAAKGLVQGIIGAGEFIGQFAKEDPFGESGRNIGTAFGIDISSPELKQFKEKSFKNLPQEEKQKLKEELDVRYPSSEGFVEGAIERGTKQIPTAVIGGGSFVSNLARSGLAGIAGETTKQLGGGETAQAIAEGSAFVAPNPTKVIQAANSRQAQLLAFGRHMGMTEEQLAPLMVGDNWFTRALSRFAKKTGKAEHALEGSQRGLGEIYDQIVTNPQAQIVLNPQQQQNFVNGLRTRFQNLPANIRNEILEDLSDLAQGPLNGERLINFYQDVNDTIGRIGGHRGRRLGGIQDELLDAISTASPQIGEELKMTNELYANYARMRTRLRPGPNEDLINSAKGIGAVGFLLTGNWPQLQALLGYTAAKRVATEFLVNPRLVNIQHKMIRALNENSVPLVNKLIDQFKEEIQEKDPEFAEMIEDEKYQPTNRKKSSQ